jgi:hypothetical protein
MLMILVQDLLPVISEDLGLALGLSILQNWGPLDDLLENLPVKTHPSAQALNQCQAVKAWGDEDWIFLVRLGPVLELLVIEAVQDIFIKDFQVVGLMYLSEDHRCTIEQAVFSYIFLYEVDVLLQELCTFTAAD